MTKKINVNKQIEIVVSEDGMPMMKFSCIDIDTDGTEHERDCYFAPFHGSFLRENVVKAACVCHELPSSSSIYSSNFSFLEKEIYDIFRDGFFEAFLPEQGGRGCVEYCLASLMDFMNFSNFMEILPEFTQAGINYISYLAGDKDLLTEARKWREPRIVEQISKLLKEALLSAQIYSESVNNRKEV